MPCSMPAPRLLKRGRSLHPPNLIPSSRLATRPACPWPCDLRAPCPAPPLVRFHFVGDLFGRLQHLSHGGVTRQCASRPAWGQQGHSLRRRVRAARPGHAPRRHAAFRARHQCPGHPPAGPPIANSFASVCARLSSAALSGSVMVSRGLPDSSWSTHCSSRDLRPETSSGEG